MQFLTISPILIPLAAAALTALFWGRPVIQRWIGLAGAVALLAACGALVAQVLDGSVLVAQMGDCPEREVLA